MKYVSKTSELNEHLDVCFGRFLIVSPLKCGSYNFVWQRLTHNEGLFDG